MKRNVTLWGKIIKPVGWDISIKSHTITCCTRAHQRLSISCCDFPHISQRLHVGNQCSSLAIKSDSLEGENKKLLCPLSPTNGRYQSELTLMITEARGT